MSKNYKKKHEDKKKDIIENNDNKLSKKELYDLKQQEKRKQKEKELKKIKKKTKKKKDKKTYKTNLIGRIFAVLMLILMAGSIIATISYSFR
jgi:lipopolysaccharide export LptBFGC system permease protein LptF